ncbi:MAG: DUF2088 domain-containing protein [Candidatus Eisenbacteria bacterium]|uniref:DUF2088 domain-containing protein n=1 Tax=Eiseniibacteriota bacterium TaxID=2212470 RepID=A0A948WDA3_UNCEI|nr:DUF2088 domain-containing protein [Candidatus Eisenbacteria bacterium]MBU1947517.1 DUF2088 domain-containing protein [Candidatus Eisenbacteria bacterium]MBU2691673.1 DUF2088 domain-containing protein [Candidatus Eisenbacteria bacterium]
MNGFELPWGAWYGDRMKRFPLPAGYRAVVRRIRGGRVLSPKRIDAALDAVMESPTLEQLACSRRWAAVAVEDFSRPARLAEILPSVLRRIHAGGIPPERTRIIFALGGHAPLDRFAMIKKCGRWVCDHYDVSNHHPYEDLVDLGVSASGIPIRINRKFAEADLRVAVGSVVPHPYAAFGGGAKIVLPGVSSIDTLEANHRPAVTGLQGGYNNIETNTARQEMEEIALRVGLEFIVNVVTDDRRRPVGLFAGHPVAAHRAAVECARRVYATPRPNRPADVAVLNAYPKDTELLQVGNAFNALRFSPPLPLKPEGIVVVTAACSMGRGYHSLHGPGMRLYRKPVEKAYLAGRPVIFFTQNLNKCDVAVSFWDGYTFESKWNHVVKRLQKRLGHKAQIEVFPCAPLQLLED